MIAEGSFHSAPPSRHHLWLVFGGAMMWLAVIAVFALEQLSKTHIELDVVSGRERTTRTIEGMVLSSKEYDTDLSKILSHPLSSSSNPKWRRAFTGQGLFDSARINHRVGGGLNSARGLVMCFTLLEPPPSPPDQQRLVRIALQAINANKPFSVNINDERSLLAIVDDNGQEIARWRR